MSWSAGTHPALAPLDEHNRKLAENVRPADWANPVGRRRYHLLVVGAGTGGLVTAAIAAALGARVALVERGLMGGDCLNVGCVPSKAVLRAARGWRDAASASERFGGPSVGEGGSFADAMERMRRIRSEISDHDSVERFAGLGVDVYLGEAVFTGPDRVRIGDREIRFRRAVVAAGARPAVPAIPGLVEAGFHTTETIFSLTSLPERLVVLGGGPIGCELAQAFASFGSRVTLLEAAERILSREDPEAAAVVEAGLIRSGVAVECGAEVSAVRTREGERVIEYRRRGSTAELLADEILVAAGRAPNVEGLGLEAAGVAFDGRGVTVDQRLRTTNTRIFAVGDIASAFHFTHVADAHARLVVRNALFFGRGSTSDLVIPSCTYTAPELARVGISHDEAAAPGDGVRTITVPMAQVDRAKLDGEDEGFLRVHLKAGSDTILGATIVGEHAGELITQITQAMVAGIGLGKLGDAIYPYPTRAEVIRKAADAWRREKLTPLARRFFGLYFRLRR